MSIEVKGDKALIRNLARFGGNLDDAVDDTVLITATAVQVTAVKDIRTQSPGKAYARGKGVIHIASKKGDAPNTDLGGLVGSIKVLHAKGSKTAHVGTDLDYGAILETTMDRPWLEPAKDKQVVHFDKRLNATIEKQIKKAKR